MIRINNIIFNNIKKIKYPSPFPTFFLTNNSYNHKLTTILNYNNHNNNNHYRNKNILRCYSNNNCSRKYLDKKDESSKSYIQYLKENRPSSFFNIYIRENLFQEFTDYDEFIGVAAEGLKKYPKESSKFYYQLSKYLANNFNEIRLPGFSSGLNRIQLLVKSIENFSSDQDDSLYEYYSSLVNILPINQSVEINNQSFSRVQLLVKLLELSQYGKDSNEFYSVSLSLFEEMSNDEVIIFNNQDYSKDEIIAKLILNKSNGQIDSSIIQTSYLYLSKYYQLNKCAIKQELNYNLYLKEKENAKKELIKDFNNIHSPYKYFSLQKLLDKEEKVQIGKELIGKKECLIKSIESELFVSQANLYLELSKLIGSDINDTVRINGQLFNKKDLIEFEYNRDNLNCQAQFEYLLEGNGCKDLTGVGDDFNIDFTKLLVLVSLISNNPRSSNLYLYLAQILSRNNWENVEQVLKVENSKKYPDYFKFSKKQLSITYLNLIDPVYPEISIDNYIGWYYLCSEMALRESETEFGKNKKEILSEIMQVNPNFGGVYYEFTTHLEKDTEIEINNCKFTKLELLLKAIDLEKEYTVVKAASFLGLTEYLRNDNNDHIQLLDGTRLNKHQILIKVFEEYPGFMYQDFYALDLIYTMEENNIESVTIKNHQFSRSEISNMVLAFKVNKQKTKFNNIINKVLKMFKFI